MKSVKVKKNLKVKKSPDEIFNWLIRNCKYYKSGYSSKDKKEMCENYLSGKDTISLDVAVKYVREFHVELTKFLDFMEEENYSFKKLIKPLVDSNLIRIEGDVTLSGPYNTKEYKKIFDPTTGLVRDYKANKSFVRFWIKENP